MFRSLTMENYKLIFSRDNAWEVMEELGHISSIELEDMNPTDTAAQKPYASQIKDISLRLDKLHAIESILVERGFLEEPEVFDELACRTVLMKLEKQLKAESNAKYFSDLLEKIDSRHSRIHQTLEHLNSISNNKHRLEDMVGVLDFLQTHLDMGFSKTGTGNFAGAARLDYMAGTLPNDEILTFQKSVFRITRGNILVRYGTLANDKTAIFMAFQGTESGVMREKLNCLAEALGFMKIPFPENLEDLQNSLRIAKTDLEETIEVEKTSKRSLFDLLNNFSEEHQTQVRVSVIYELKTILLKQLCVLDNLNKLGQNGVFFVASFWLPESRRALLEDTLYSLKSFKGFQGYILEKVDEPSWKITPPTKFRTLGIFDSFQNIVDTYGVPRYKEANPGLFTTITFPFLFGVMFGDIGHGGIVMAFGIALLLKPHWFPKALQNVKYLMFAMGFFAFYCGLIYNDFFAVPLISQPSCYESVGEDKIARKSPDCVYAVGIDHAWHESSNSISFLNSYKMKISIVYGVIHMILGIFLKGANCLYFSNTVDFIFDFLPQLIFMLVTFGYMVVCIVIKWFNDYSSNPSKAPSIIALFINLVSTVDYPLYADAATQLFVQRILAAIAVICVPLMLFGKPIIMSIAQSKASQKLESNPPPSEENGDESGDEAEIKDEGEEEKIPLIQDQGETHPAAHGGHAKDHENENMAEILVHQAIETIEFVLGSVSNTASYLRLWALSLAHSQLAKVFLSMLLQPYLVGNNGVIFDTVMIILMFIALMGVTTAVLLLMDLLECFLHALRLHWVEFQNKFYKGDGRKFEPFSFINFVSARF